MKNRFDKMYEQDTAPWDHDKVEPLLKETLKKLGLKKIKALDIGCGKGTDSIYMAGLGYEVLGLDFSQKPIDIATDRVKKFKNPPKFKKQNFLIPLKSKFRKFNFAFDRGCFHSVNKKDRKIFAANVHHYLKKNGLWLCLCGSKDEKRKMKIGPPRLSAFELVKSLEPFFEILELKSVIFGTRDHHGWLVLSRKRK